MVYQEVALTSSVPLVVWSMWRWYRRLWRDNASSNNKDKGADKGSSNKDSNKGDDDTCSDIDATSADSDDVSADIDANSADSDATSADIDDICADNDEIGAEDDDVSADNDDNCADNDDICADNVDNCADNDDICADNDDISEDNVDICAENDKYNGGDVVLLADIANLRAEIAELRADIVELGVDNHKLEADANKLGADTPDILTTIARNKKTVLTPQLNMDRRPDIANIVKDHTKPSAKYAKLCNDINKICGVIGKLCPDIDEFRTDASKVSRQTLHSVDAGKLRIDITERSSDIAKLRANITYLRADIAELSTYIAEHQYKRENLEDDWDKEMKALSPICGGIGCLPWSDCLFCNSTLLSQGNVEVTSTSPSPLSPLPSVPFTLKSSHWVTTLENLSVTSTDLLPVIAYSRTVLQVLYIHYHLFPPFSLFAKRIS
jgi:cell division protein FtsB